MVNTTFISFCRIIGSLNLYLTHGSSAFNTRCLLNEPLETVLIGAHRLAISSHCSSHYEISQQLLYHLCDVACVLNFLNVENYEENKFITFLLNFLILLPGA